MSRRMAENSGHDGVGALGDFHLAHCAFHRRQNWHQGAGRDDPNSFAVRVAENALVVLRDLGKDGLRWYQ